MIKVDIRNLVTKKLSRKLENCHGTRYAVKRVISPQLVELKLFPEFEVHPVFHINILKYTCTDSSPLGYIELLGSLININEEIEYEFSAIVVSRLFGKAKKL